MYHNETDFQRNHFSKGLVEGLWKKEKIYKCSPSNKHPLNGTVPPAYFYLVNLGKQAEKLQNISLVSMLT